jgi:hypothetical protein
MPRDPGPGSAAGHFRWSRYGRWCCWYGYGREYERARGVWVTHARRRRRQYASRAAAFRTPVIVVVIIIIIIIIISGDGGGVRGGSRCPRAASDGR